MRQHGAPGRRPAVLALATTFVVNGVTFSSLFPRYPQIIEAVGATPQQFGLVLVAGGCGGLVAGLSAPLVARRLGLVRTVAVTGVALAVGVVGVGAAAGLGLLAAAVVIAAGADALHDISMNELAVGEQTTNARSIMGRLHGAWSLGSTAGAGIGALLASLGVPVRTHMAGVALIAITTQLLAARHLQPVRTPSISSPAPTGTHRRRAPRVTLIALLGASILGAMFVEMTPLDWSALTLSTDFGASPGLAGLGPVVFSAGILIARSAIDPLVDRFGVPRVLRAGNLLAAAAMASGLAAATVTDQPVVLLCGIAVAGLGVAANFPLLFGAGDHLAQRLGLPAGSGTSIIGTVPRVVGLVMPGVVGLIAGGVGLTPALAVVVAGGLLCALAMPRVMRRE